jgi:cytochrome c biogenesis protein CcmG/thiol:disulfide interchange protein DsbE
MRSTGMQSMMQRTVSFVQDRNRWTAFTALVMLLGVAWTAASMIPEAEISRGDIVSPQVGFLAPDFDLDSLDGAAVSLSALRGRVIVINLWASWCPPCRAEMPALQAVYADLAARGLVVLGVNMTYQDSAAEAISFATDLGLTFPIAFDRSGEVARSYSMRALPSTYFVDPRGVIQQVIVGGPLNEATLRSIVMDLLEEAQ